MNDYLFSSKKVNDGSLSKSLKEIYSDTDVSTHEYHGYWGSLAVVPSHYRGFQPFENERHLMIVIGGPVLYFQKNDFLVKEDSNEATLSIYKRWIIENKIQWDEDLSGPFTILLIDKVESIITIVTDLMAFIPIYCCQKQQELYLGTHVDALAKISGEEQQFDQVSLADFVLNDAVTYPYTAYKNLRQIAPSSINIFTDYSKPALQTDYWIPEEINPFKNIQEAADALRNGINGYITRVTENMTSVAQFISAGEDSRALSGMLPEQLERDAFIFLDSMNREGKIAKRVAETYGANFNVTYRSPTHYLEILPEATKLIGSGHQYVHAHSLGFDKVNNLAEYPAVFGGYLSDSLLKAAYAHKPRGYSRLPFLPEFHIKGESRTKAINSSVIDESVLLEINKRRLTRFKSVESERPLTAHEWFVLRPATMRVTIPNLYTTRRLFRSYEPFMCKEAVKISASVPTSWKLNRRLFNRAMKPYLRKSKWLLHADGRLPYFSWWTNMPLKAVIWAYRQVARRIGFIQGNQGPWASWSNNTKSIEWLSMLQDCKKSQIPIYFLRKRLKADDVLTAEQLSTIQKVNLMQILLFSENEYQ